MNAETGNLPLLIVGALLALGGLHGVFFYAGPRKKLASWGALQAGLIFFFLFREPLSSLSKVLLLETTLVSVTLLLILVAFLLKAGGKRRGPQ